MKKKNKKKSRLPGLLVSLALIAVCLGLVLALVRARSPEGSLVPAAPAAASAAPGQPGGEAAAYLEEHRPVYAAESPAGQRIAAAMDRAWSFRTEGEPYVAGDSAEQKVVITLLRGERFTADAEAELQPLLEQAAASARRRSEIYGEDGAYLPALLEDALCRVLEQRGRELAAFAEEQTVTVPLRYENGAWQVEPFELPAADALSPDALAEALLQRCAETALPVALHYSIPEDVKVVPAAPEENYHVSDDPMEIAALLDSPEARALIGDRELVWNPELDFLEDSKIYLYLDETLLVITWQQVEWRPVGTFSEIIVADGSQLRRKVAGDTFGSKDFRTTSGYAKEVNAVLALGGDFYNHHQRICGITVLDGQIYRFSPLSADSCMITEDGDMLFVYHHQYDNDQQAEAQQYVTDNKVRFSLAFGPVLIDEGKDVTPEWYRWGEISDTYARSALGMLGDRHYLTVNLNCSDAHYYLATLQQATDALLSRGCVKAYALDGGQTATTVFHGQLINPVQFGWEKPISDIIYFVSALPEE